MHVKINVCVCVCARARLCLCLRRTRSRNQLNTHVIFTWVSMNIQHVCASVRVPGRKVETSLDRPRGLPGKHKGSCILACIRDRARAGERERERERESPRNDQWSFILLRLCLFRRKALRVIPRGKHRLTVYRARQVSG